MDERIDGRERQNGHQPVRHDDQPKQRVDAGLRGVDVGFHDCTPSYGPAGWPACVPDQPKLLREFSSIIS